VAASDATVDEIGAAIAISGHTGDVAFALSHLSSSVARHRRLAMSALARCDSLSNAQLLAALTDPDSAVRHRACQLAASTDIDLTPALNDPEPSVVEVAAWAVGEHATVDNTTRRRLEQLAQSHTDTLVREAAVAALGAIGHPESIEAILAGAIDKPAIRRRAVLALVSYEGREVDSALKRALDDRDWQVRQAAEDVLS